MFRSLAKRQAWPPGLLRLGLPLSRLEELAQAAKAGPSAALELLVKRKELTFDAAQQQASRQLDSVWQVATSFPEEVERWTVLHEQWKASCARLEAEHEAKKKKDSEAKEVEALRLPSEPARPRLQRKGCYLWGEVGRGKTLLMDLLALSLQKESQGKSPELRRVHFHEFTHQLHRQLHSLRARGARNAMATALEEVTNGCPAVLCFDEFQITTIADASLLAPMFSELLSLDAILVATSNRAPEQLYLDGLGRETHLPRFERLLRAEVQVHHLEAPTDYRQAVSASTEPDFRVGTELAFGEAEQRQMPIAWGRSMPCRVRGGVGSFDFDELCGTPLSSEDYLALIRSGLHTFQVAGVPRFGLKSHNEARRFTNLVDALYEHQCRLICSAETGIDELLTGMEGLCGQLETDQPAMGIGGSEKSIRHGDVTFRVTAQSPCRPDTFATAEADAEAGTSTIRLAGADASTSQDGVAGVMAAAVDSLRETGFAARRCASRLHEMNSDAYRQGHELRWRSA